MGRERTSDVLSHTLQKRYSNEENKMEDDNIQMMDQGDSMADALAAVALILIFVTTCIFWVSGQ
tara:strand:+ start:793 stop:984 length:192 start_codon:yes stop_codon:yes gene_type:complete